MSELSGQAQFCAVNVRHNIGMGLRLWMVDVEVCWPGPVTEDMAARMLDSLPGGSLVHNEATNRSLVLVSRETATAAAALALAEADVFRAAAGVMDEDVAVSVERVRPFDDVVAEVFPNGIPPELPTA
ncbi:hypothetical protein OG563_26610 [Nocardia vinacea]|uniref:Uncharacterized protein n=1 Tax=Nocardia vinacea TaxID=96468 RepID=A0ABZ1YI58_9NOCA|nr:hypothetical protein [Nocardia vinacea]